MSVGAYDMMTEAELKCYKYQSRNSKDIHQITRSQEDTRQEGPSLPGFTVA
jgi:hypothetical protein